MNRQIKVLSILTVFSVVFVIVLFFIALNDYNYNILMTLKYFWIMFLFPLAFVLLLQREKRILNSPLKEVFSEVVNMQKKYDNLKHQYYFTASFKVHNDLLWTFRIPIEIFNKLTIGQQGILSYRERNSKLYFVFFTSLENVDAKKDYNTGD